MLAWDILVLNGYLALNLLIPFYILFSHYRDREPNRRLYVPAVFLSILWAVSLHLVTAFLYAGLPARPYWHSALLGPRFLATAFAAGPALMIIILAVIRRHTAYADRAGHHPEARAGRHGGRPGVPGHPGLRAVHRVLPPHPPRRERAVPLLRPRWTPRAGALDLDVGRPHRARDGHAERAPLRRTPPVLYLACAMLFVGVLIDKGIGTIIPGFVPEPWGRIPTYSPTWVELTVSAGLWALGAFVFTVLAKAAIPIELGRSRWGDSRTLRDLFPLPLLGERVRLRGNPETPHPNPLPSRERERTQKVYWTVA